MDLATAQRYAEKIVAWIGPHCERIEIAGSVRRQRPECADVDIVCIPKATGGKDLLGTAVDRKNLLLEFLKRYVAESGGKARFIAGGEKEGKQVLLELPKCQLDLWFADERTFALRWLIRTGSKEHNIWLAERAQKLNGHLQPYEGVSINGVEMPCPTEACVYAALEAPFIEPENREEGWIAANVKPIWTGAIVRGSAGENK